MCLCHIVCSATADPKEKQAKISKSTYQFMTCWVHLCTKKRDNRKFNCFGRFHQLKDLSSLREECEFKYKWMEEAEKEECIQEDVSGGSF